MRTKVVETKLFGQKRVIATVSTNVISDLLSIVDSYRRNKLSVNLSQERLDAVETQLSVNPGEVRSLSSLRKRINEWRDLHDHSSFDASSYYNDERAKAYTQEVGQAQVSLTSGCLYLLKSILKDINMTNKIFIDLGCGSGLSTRAFNESLTSFSPPRRSHHHHFTIGVDSSLSMLVNRVNLQDEVILANIGVRWPFRMHAFDSSFSVAAVHYLLPNRSNKQVCCNEDVGGEDGVKSEMMEILLKESLRCVDQGCAWQLFPKGGYEDMVSFKRRALVSGWGMAEIVADNPHRRKMRGKKSIENSSSSSLRWYLFLSRQISTDQLFPCFSQQVSCPIFHGNETKCLLWFRGIENDEFMDERIKWMREEHQRYLKREARVAKRIKI